MRERTENEARKNTTKKCREGGKEYQKGYEDISKRDVKRCVVRKKGKGKEGEDIFG